MKNIAPLSTLSLPATTAEKTPLHTRCFSSVYKKGQKAEKRKQKSQEPLALYASLPVWGSLAKASTPPALSPLSHCPPAVEELFLRTCSEMLHMESTNSTKTILSLQSQAFQDSPFFGGEVVIEEFSTAPHLFNVSIYVQAQAEAVIQTHAAEFMRFIQEGDFSFGIHRLETALLDADDRQSDTKDSHDPQQGR